MVEITSEEQNKVKRMKRTEDSLRDVWAHLWLGIDDLGSSGLFAEWMGTNAKPAPPADAL